MAEVPGLPFGAAARGRHRSFEISLSLSLSVSVFRPPFSSLSFSLVPSPLLLVLYSFLVFERRSLSSLVSSRSRSTSGRDGGMQGR